MNHSGALERAFGTDSVEYRLVGLQSTQGEFSRVLGVCPIGDFLKAIRHKIEQYDTSSPGIDRSGEDTCNSKAETPIQ